MRALGEIVATRESKRGRTATRQRLFVLSQPIDAGARRSAVRSHWGIENQLHWVMDVIFDEHRSRARANNAPLNLTVLRRIALNLTKVNPAKGSTEEN